MKTKSIFSIGFIAVLSICLFLSAGCREEEKPGGDQPSYTYPPATEAGNTAAALQTEALQPEGPTPTPKVTAAPLPEDQKGIPQEDAEILYDEQFENNMLCDDTLASNDNGYTITDGKLTFGVDQWYALVPDFYCETGADYNQFEYYIDLSSQYGPDPSADGHGTYMACLIGVRVNTTDNTGIPTQDTGYWISASHSRELIVYPSGNNTSGYWPDGGFRISLEDGFMDMKHLLITDCGDQLFFYILSEDGTRSLFLRAEIGAKEIKSYDKDGNLLNTSDNLLTDNGGYLWLFNHYGNTTVERIAIKASK